MKSLNNSNPMARLKRTITIEKGTVERLQKATKMPTIQEEPSGDGSAAAGPPKAMSFLDQIKAKVQLRYVALHP